MKTNQEMVRKMGNFNVVQRTSDGYFNATYLLKQWNDNAKSKSVNSTDLKTRVSMTKDCFCFLESKRDFLYKSLDGLKKVCTFAVLHFYIHIRIGDFLCPILNYCLQYKQRFLRTYSPQSRYGSVATWRKPLLSSYIINF